MNYSLQKTKAHITFFKYNTPFRAVSIASTINVENELKMILNFPSFKTHLDLNQDGSDILNHINNFDSIETNENYFIKNLIHFMERHCLENEIKVTLQLNLPKVTIEREGLLKIYKETMKIEMFE